MTIIWLWWYFYYLCKKCHKDIDARWTKKGGAKYYGYKDHAKVDLKTKIITDFVVTSANVHDSQAIESLICGGRDKKGEHLFLDSAYVGYDDVITKQELVPEIIEKNYRNTQLTDEQKESNRNKAKKRCRIEHVFGFMEQSMKGLFFRGIGILRATFYIGFTNLIYNMCRLVQIKKYHPEFVKM